MKNIMQNFPIEDVPIAKTKRRRPKYYWDIDVINEIAEIRSRNPSASWRQIIFTVLEEYLTPHEYESIDTHFRRIYERIKSMNLNNEFCSSKT